MSRFSFSLMLFFSLLSMSITATAEDITTTTQSTTTTASPAVTTTQVNPVTQETTTTIVNPATNQTTVTKVNPVTQQTTTTIITPTPAPKEVVVAPSGYEKCATVPAGWFKGMWVSEHNVCQYNTQTGTFEGVAWIAGHWVCMKAKADTGECLNWDWKPGRWVKSLEMY